MGNNQNSNNSTKTIIKTDIKTHFSQLKFLNSKTIEILENFYEIFVLQNLNDEKLIKSLENSLSNYFNEIKNKSNSNENIIENEDKGNFILKNFIDEYFFNINVIDFLVKIYIGLTPDDLLNNINKNIENNNKNKEQMEILEKFKMTLKQADENILKIKNNENFNN